ncbi:hypothetical protein ACIRO1_35140 [Streptomyces sp. NPDC102381]|uniref:hypothetical protein n=1 Tax=Streptomyces sp. NPDC102381 TaxID=3366164 RepID=UPI00382F7C5E
MSRTTPEAPDTFDWAALRGCRVVLDDGWLSEEDRPGRTTRHQGAVSDIKTSGTGAIELTLTRYDGRTQLLRPVGHFTVTDQDSGTVLYTPKVSAPCRVPMTFIDAVRQIIPERWGDLEWVMRTTSVDQIPPHKVSELVDLAAQVEWECTRDGDVLDDPAAPAQAYAQAARHVVQMWESDAGPANTGENG